MGTLPKAYPFENVFVWKLLRIHSTHSQSDLMFSSTLLADQTFPIPAHDQQKQCSSNLCPRVPGSFECQNLRITFFISKLWGFKNIWE